MALALRDGSGYNEQEIVIERPDGSRRTALAHANPFYDAAGRVVGAVNVLLDITGRTQAEPGNPLRRRPGCLSGMAPISAAVSFGRSKNAGPGPLGKSCRVCYGGSERRAPGMTIHLPDDLAQFIQAEVRSGHFPSEDAAIAEAVRLLRRQLRQAVPATPDPLLGALGDAAGEMDEVVADAMKQREQQPWRLSPGE